MPISDYRTLCFGIGTAAGDKCIVMPGGVEVCASIPSLVPVTGAELVQDLLGKLNTAMAPLQPIFSIIDAVIAVFDCIKATATLNPRKILQCIPNLAERINKLLELVPQMSIPVMVKGFIDCLILYLESLAANIQRSQAYFNRIIAAGEASANTDIELGPIIDCATGDVDQLLVFMGEQSAPINRLIGLINAFLKLLGLPCIPSMGSPSLSDGFLLLIDKLIDFLQFLSNLLVIPLPIPELAVDADDC